VIALAAALSCGTKANTTPPAPCDAVCQDGVAVRGLRETAKLAYNLTLQGKPVGTHDETAPCPLGGSVHITGSASSNAVQGSTEVDLVYVLSKCHYAFHDTDPKATYELTFDGTMTQKGTLAVQPTATTALVMHSDAMAISGNVYDPPIPYASSPATPPVCVVDLGQNGNNLTGNLCDRPASSDL
jgi:hypothetical protein